MFEKVLPKAGRLTVMDIRVQYYGGDSTDAAASAKVLQGLVNRKGLNKLYLFNDSTDATHDIGGKYWNVQKSWLEQIREFSSIPINELKREQGIDGGLHGLIRHFSDYIEGLIVWDNNSHNKVNMAAFGAAVTIASQMNALAVSPEIMEQIVSWGFTFPVLVDLREYKFKSDHELLDWCIDKYWDKTNHNINAVFSLGMDGWSPNDKWGDNWLSNYIFNEGSIDYAVATNGFAFNVNISDGNDEHVLMKLLKKYPEGNTAILGWVPAHPFMCGFSEVPTCLNATSHFVIGVNGFSNLSVFASFADYKAEFSAPTVHEINENNVFINFISSDGDALHCVYRGMFSAFTKEKNNDFGLVPITWTIAPYLASLAPPVYKFFCENLPRGSDFAIGWADKISTIYDSCSAEMATNWKQYAELSGISIIWTVNSEEETQRADICNWDSIIVGYSDSREEARLSKLNENTSVFGTWTFGDNSAGAIIDGIRECVSKLSSSSPLFMTVSLGAAFDASNEFYTNARIISDVLNSDSQGYHYKFVNAGDMAATYKKYVSSD
ncbi:MAG TPA: hypothetical protein VIK78_21835 [Ruminiclostridium sp.]